MKINYKEKPTSEQLKNYKEKLEKFLSAHNAVVFIGLWEEPLRMESYVNGQHISTDYRWIGDIKVSTPTINELSVHVMSSGIDENTTDRIVWNDAFDIQDQIYKRLGLNPKTPPSTSGDPYWKLWDYLE